MQVYRIHDGEAYRLYLIRKAGKGYEGITFDSTCVRIRKFKQLKNYTALQYDVSLYARSLLEWLDKHNIACLKRAKQFL